MESINEAGVLQEAGDADSKAYKCNFNISYQGVGGGTGRGYFLFFFYCAFFFCSVMSCLLFLID